MLCNFIVNAKFDNSITIKINFNISSIWINMSFNNIINIMFVRSNEIKRKTWSISWWKFDNSIISGKLESFRYYCFILKRKNSTILFKKVRSPLKKYSLHYIFSWKLESKVLKWRRPIIWFITWINVIWLDKNIDIRVGKTSRNVSTEQIPFNSFGSW